MLTLVAYTGTLRCTRKFMAITHYTSNGRGGWAILNSLHHQLSQLAAEEHRRFFRSFFRENIRLVRSEPLACFPFFFRCFSFGRFSLFFNLTDEECESLCIVPPAHSHTHICPWP